MSSSNSTRPPQAPAEVYAVLRSHTYVSLKWNSSIGATGYTVSVVSLSDADPNSRLALVPLTLFEEKGRV